MRRTFAFAFVALAVLTMAPRASAHANLLSSDPASGTRLDDAPDSVVLRFSEEPQVSLSDIQVLASDSTRVDDGKVGPGAEPKTLTVGVHHLDRGTYTVAWHCVSKVDGHATAGSFAFGVGVTPSASKSSAPSSPPPNPLEVAGRILFLAGVFIAFGGAFVGWLVFAVARPRLRTLVVAGAGIAVIGVLVLGLAQQRAAHASIAALFATSIGRALISRAVVLVVAAIVVLALPGRAGFGVATLAGLAAMYAEVVAGHAAATGRLGGPALNVAAQVVHFAAGAMWMGGLAAVLVAIRRLAPDEAARGVRRYATTAAIALFTVAATGAYRAVGEIGSIDGFLHSSYGYFVIAKVVLLGALAALGARQRFVNLPAIGSTLRGLVRVGRQELVVAGAIVVATGLLTALSPPPPSAASSDRIVATGSDFARTAEVEFKADPGRAGINSFSVRVLEGLRPQRVKLRFAYELDRTIAPSELSLRRKGDDWVRTGANMSIAGRWTVTAVLQGRTTSAEIELTVATPCPTQTVPGGSGPVVHMQTLSGGASDQTYADPGTPGGNEIHFTFFDAKGNELDIGTTPDITAWRTGRAARALAVRRFSKGHFIASGRLASGAWRFDAQAVPRGSDRPLRACFEERI